MEFLTRNNITLVKHSERPWGSFEVAFSIDGQQWFQVPNSPWGWGFSLLEAGALVLLTVPGNETHREFFKLYFGQERLDELTNIVQS